MIKIYRAKPPWLEGPSLPNIFESSCVGTINPISCIETQSYNLEEWYLKVTVSSDHAEIIRQDDFVCANTAANGAQFFRIKNLEKKGTKITFTCLHVIFDAADYILGDVRPTNLMSMDYLEWCKLRCDSYTPFSFRGATGTNQPATAYFIRKSMMDVFYSIPTKFPDTRIYADNYTLCYTPTGLNARDIPLSYGRNIQEAQLIECWDDVCTKILPVGSGGLILPELYMRGETQYYKPYTKVISFDVPEQDDEGNEIPESTRIATLRSLAMVYLKEHAVPKISYAIKAHLDQPVEIGDVATVKHPFLNITAEVQQYSFDCNTRRYKEISFGNYNTSPKKIWLSSFNKIDINYKM